MTEQELTPDDELGQQDAVEAPEGDYDEDEYVEDPDYDPLNDDVDPESVNESLGASLPEVASEGGDI